MFRKLRARMSFANVVSVMALTIAMGTGGAYAANTIGSADIIDGEVKTVDLGADAVTAPKIKSNSVDTSEIVDGAIKTVDISASAVQAANIATSAVQTTDIGAGAVQNTDIGADAVTGAKVLDESLTGADVLDETIAGKDVLNESITGADTLDDSIGPDDVSQLNGDTDIQDNTITTFDIATNAIDSDEVLDFGLSNEDVGVLFAQINGDGTVANSSGGVTTIKLGTGTYEVDFGRDISSCGMTATQGEASPGGAPGAIMGVTDRSGNANGAFVTARTDANVLTDRAFQMTVVC
jgi:hypothetical protein